VADKDKGALVRLACQWCGCGKHAIQYTGTRFERVSEQTTVAHPDRPGVCLVCPRCDSPSVVVSE